MRIGGILFIVLLVFGCSVDQKFDSSIEKSNSAMRALLPEKTGITFANNLHPTDQLNIIEYLYYYNGGGVAVGDLNNDGLEDIYLSANQEADKLYLNQDSLSFKDISTSSLIDQSATWSTGVAIDDINGDGFNDIYVCKVNKVSVSGAHNLLYINNGDLTFKESSKEYGLDFAGYSTHAGFFDFDHDGDLDMYLLNHSVHSVRSYGNTEIRDVQDLESGDRLYENRLNNIEKKFVDVTQKAGIYSSALGYGLALSIADINGDGWDDIYVGNDFHENDYIYINNKNGTFSESQGDLIQHSSKFTMGVDVADMNNDGRAEIFTTDMLPYKKSVAMKSGGEDTDQIFQVRKDLGFGAQYARNHFQQQKENGEYIDIGLGTETYATDWSWSVLLQDFDNNGKNDIYISNGIVRRPNDLDYINYINTLGERTNEPGQLENMLALMPSEKLPNVLFSQDEEGDFSNLNSSFSGQPTFSNGAAYADFDNDGDLDLIVNNINEPASLIENKNEKKGNFLSVKLESNKVGRTNKGAKVTVYSDSKIFTNEYQTTRGYQSSSTHNLHFGLGKKKAIDSVRVVWPDGQCQTINDPAVNELLNVSKSGTLRSYTYKKTISPSNMEIFDFAHLENQFKDYNYEKLIPEALSKEGPAVAYADINGDGISDLFIGNGRYQEARLYYGTNKGGFNRQNTAAFKLDAKYEDVDAAFFDFDNDGDLDLYVVSGGSDVKELDKLLEDRLYLNDKGELFRVPLSLPHTNGSTVSTADFDGDGYTDIFVGARSIPSSYGLSPYSFVLKNRKGGGVDIAFKARLGMVTDSDWKDIDGDGDIDLLTCGDWMNITILENQGDGILKIKEDKTLNNSAGLWNTIEIVDVNHDGRLDILAGNVGTNFKWRSDSTRSVDMYVVDLDKNGQSEPIIFAPYFDGRKPFVGLERLLSQAPLLKKKFHKFSDFATVDDINDLTGGEENGIIEHKTIQEQRSMIFLASDSGYKSIPLPKEAQNTTIQDFVISNKGEIIYISNHLDFLTELGENSGMSGAILGKYLDLNNGFDGIDELGLPADLNPRHIVMLDDDRKLIIVNSGRHIILSN